MCAAYGPVVRIISSAPLVGASFVRFCLGRLASRASSGSDRDSVDVHRVGAPSGWPVRWSSLLFAASVLACAEVVASAGSEARHHESTPLDFARRSGLPIDYRLRNRVSLQNGPMHALLRPCLNISRLPWAVSSHLALVSKCSNVALYSSISSPFISSLIRSA